MPKRQITSGPYGIIFNIKQYAYSGHQAYPETRSRSTAFLAMYVAAFWTFPGNVKLEQNRDCNKMKLLLFRLMPFQFGS